MVDKSEYIYNKMQHIPPLENVIPENVSLYLGKVESYFTLTFVFIKFFFLHNCFAELQSVAIALS